MNNQNIKYRKANVDDALILARMRWNFLFEISKDKSDSRKEDLIHHLNEYFRDQLVNNTIVIWLAEVEEKIIATSTMVIWKAPFGADGIGKNGRGYILNMYTIPQYRRQGLGKILMEKLIESGKEMKLEKLHLHATEMGTPLYKNFGFEPPYYQELELKL